METVTTAKASALPFATTRTVMRWILAALFAAAGAAHLAAPEELVKITPDWVPDARRVIFVTALCEFAGALALVAESILSATGPKTGGRLTESYAPRLRVSAGIALAAYTICVWPANIKQAADGIVIPHIPDSWWYHGPRLALQPVIAWWALFSAGAIDWPLGRGRRKPRPGVATSRPPSATPH